MVRVVHVVCVLQTRILGPLGGRCPVHWQDGTQGTPGSGAPMMRKVCWDGLLTWNLPLKYVYGESFGVDC